MMLMRPEIHVTLKKHVLLSKNILEYKKEKSIFLFVIFFPGEGLRLSQMENLCLQIKEIKDNLRELNKADVDYTSLR